MPTVRHNFDDGDVICIESDEDIDLNIDAEGPENGSKAEQNVPDLSWLTNELAEIARAEVEKQKREIFQVQNQAQSSDSDDDIEIISANVTQKPMVVPVSIRIPKAMEVKLRALLVGEGGVGYRANSTLTKALETALGCSIKNFNFFMPETMEQDRKFQPLSPTEVEKELTSPESNSTSQSLKPSNEISRSHTKKETVDQNKVTSKSADHRAATRKSIDSNELVSRSDSRLIKQSAITNELTAKSSKQSDALLKSVASNEPTQKPANVKKTEKSSSQNGSTVNSAKQTESRSKSPSQSVTKTSNCFQDSYYKAGSAILKYHQHTNAVYRKAYEPFESDVGHCKSTDESVLSKSFNEKSCSVVQSASVSSTESRNHSLPSSSSISKQSNVAANNKAQSFPARNFYGISAAEYSPDSTLESRESEDISNQKDDSFGKSQLPLFVNGRPTNGRMVCKKSAFYSTFASQEKTSAPKPTDYKRRSCPEKKSLCFNDSNQIVTDKISTKSNKRRLTKSPRLKSPKSIETSTDCVDATSMTSRPKRLAAISAASLNTIYSEELSRKGESSESSEMFDEFYLNSASAKAAVSPKTISPKTASNCKKSLFGKSSVPKGHLASITKTQVAKKSASQYPEPNEVEQFRSKVRQINREGTRFLQSFKCRTVIDAPFIGIDVFENIFWGFKASFDCSKLMQIFGKSVRKHFLFENWTVTHVSVEAASTILAYMGKNPEIFYAATRQLSKTARVKLSNILPKKFAAETSPKSSLENSRTSKRTKLLSEKFQHSNFLNNGRLMAAFTSCNKSENNDDDLEDIRMVEKDESLVTKVRIRPKFRHLSNSSVTLKLPPDWRVEQNLDKTEEFVCSNAKRLRTCRSNLDKKRSDCETTKPVEKTVNFDDQKDVSDSEVWTPVKMPGSKPVRKFPSNFEIPTKFLQKRATEETPESRKRQVKRIKTSTIEMPTFTLAGITETLPSYVEGWFSNKLTRLKNLSEMVEDSKLRHSNSNGASNMNSKNRTKDRPARRSVRRVVVSVGNIPLENIVDLADLGRSKSENTLSLVGEITLDNCQKLNSSNGNIGIQDSSSVEKSQSQGRPELVDVLKVAKKIEKISLQGIGAPPPKMSTPFLPPGWIRRVNEVTLREEFIRCDDGFVAPTLECAMTKYFRIYKPKIRQPRKIQTPKRILNSA